MKIITKRKEVQTFFTKAYCPECGNELFKDNYVLTSYPAQYPYYCIKCGFKTTSFEDFPKIEYIENEK